MHLLRLFLTAWLELGIVTTFFLFWLCKRTAQRTQTLDKPVLDQAAFQQLLAAASALQAQNNRKPSTLNDSMVPSYSDKRVPRRDELFWRVATATAVAAVSTLLLLASLDRLSPLPKGLEAVQQEVSFRRGRPQSGEVATETSTMEPQATKTERPDVAETPIGSMTTGSSQKIGNPKRHSIYESEADVVAQDTVVRYGRRRSR